MKFPGATYLTVSLFTLSLLSSCSDDFSWTKLNKRMPLNGNLGLSSLVLAEPVAGEGSNRGVVEPGAGGGNAEPEPGAANLQPVEGGGVPVEPGVGGGVLTPVEPGVGGGVLTPVEPGVGGGVLTPVEPGVGGGVLTPVEPGVGGGILPPTAPGGGNEPPLGGLPIAPPPVNPPFEPPPAPPPFESPPPIGPLPGNALPFAMKLLGDISYSTYSFAMSTVYSYEGANPATPFHVLVAISVAVPRTLVADYHFSLNYNYNGCTVAAGAINLQTWFEVLSDGEEVLSTSQPSTATQVLLNTNAGDSADNGGTSVPGGGHVTLNPGAATFLMKFRGQGPGLPLDCITDIHALGHMDVTFNEPSSVLTFKSMNGALISSPPSP